MKATKRPSAEIDGPLAELLIGAVPAGPRFGIRGMRDAARQQRRDDSRREHCAPCVADYGETSHRCPSVRFAATAAGCPDQRSASDRPKHEGTPYTFGVALCAPRVWTLHGAFQRDVSDPAFYGEQQPVDRASEIHLRFRRLTPGLAFGARWAHRL
ncbi:hypothetical protein ACFYRC_31215 [Streptomyces sp. NPDC005279]|uniref:hypothetical protein n=1 Tax=Streptomyces sp. NPDC005279 TaxID=3364712 RepID=UPI0036BF5D63